MKFVETHTVGLRDKVLENSILFMTQALTALDFHQSIRKGEVGRLEANHKVMMLNFHGCGKTKYDQRFAWTVEHHYIDIRNNV